MATISRSVLVVEDDKIVREAIVNYLSEFNIKSVVATDGVSGLQKARRQDFCTIVTDINLPRMNGVDLIDEVRKLSNHKKTQIIVLSAYMDKNVITNIKNKVQKAFVKPLSLQVLLGAIEQR